MHTETAAFLHLAARQHLQHLALTDVLDPLHQPLLRVPSRILTPVRAQAQIPGCLNQSRLQMLVLRP